MGGYGVKKGFNARWDSQKARSLDEASLTLRANSFTTVRRVLLPLLRPAIVAALVYSFVRAMTAISAVIFLVSANYDMATSYILGRVENGDYNIQEEHLADAIELLVERRQKSLSKDRSPKNPY